MKVNDVKEHMNETKMTFTFT